MALGRYKDLCIDAVDARAEGAFWASLLGWDLDLLDDGDACLREGDMVRVWVNTVPEPTTVKNRLHIDVNVASVLEAESLGAVVVDDTQRWTVMRDPDGQVFCVFVREELNRRPYELVLDVTGDPAGAHRVAAWWQVVFGGTLGDDERGFSWLEAVPGLPFEAVTFSPVPEAKATKNRMHVDVWADDLDGLVRHGATMLRDKGDGGIGWTVLADQEGNEFCAFTP
ncbi:MAG: VOC family protein [Intrasporangium sp.]|uniref:VOC family protein n=1 Tax=Intrasporangium sp. TaxID=1925024 RepID=UPI0026495ADE|nr:VOC family protein [Intrasporangium sp.]MDN5794890.1 VOC family protein [Intrasporangium sp.]